MCQEGPGCEDDDGEQVEEPLNEGLLFPFKNSRDEDEPDDGGYASDERDDLDSGLKTIQKAFGKTRGSKAVIDGDDQDGENDPGKECQPLSGSHSFSFICHRRCR